MVHLNQTNFSCYFIKNLHLKKHQKIKQWENDEERKNKMFCSSKLVQLKIEKLNPILDTITHVPTCKCESLLNGKIKDVQ